jgi:hypothetical protein
MRLAPLGMRVDGTEGLVRLLREAGPAGVLVSKSIFEILFIHIDTCTKGCDPSGMPLCEDGETLLKSATRHASMLAAPIPPIPRSPYKA